MTFQPGTPIDLTPDARRRLGHLVSELLDDLEVTYQPYFNAIRVWNEWVEAKPKTKVKNWPLKNASNIVVPLSQVMVDAMVNRAYAGYFGGSGRRIWLSQTQNDQVESNATEVARWVNWGADNNDFNFRLNVWDWLNSWVGFGSGVLCGNWRDDVRQVFVRQGSGKSRKIISRPVRFARGPVFEVPPREQLLWDTNYAAGDAPVLARQYIYDWLTVRRVAQANEWNMEEVNAIRTATGLDGQVAEIQRSKGAMDEFSVDKSLMMKHDIREVYVDWPILEAGRIALDRPGDVEAETFDIPIVVYLHRKTRRVLHAKAAPYLWPGKPAFDGFYAKRAGTAHTVGLVKRLQPMQEAMTALLNQAIDARTRANSVWARTSLRENLNKTLDPSTMLYDPGLNTIAFEDLKTAPFDEISLMNTVNILAERLTGQADPVMGRESRSGGHPSPATSTLALMQQADVVSGGRRELARMQLSRCGEFAAALYQQYEENEGGRIQQVLGVEDAAKVLAYLNDGSGAMRFDLVAMNESSNPEAEMRRAIAVSQMNSNYWAFVLRAVSAAQLARQQQDPIMMQAAIVSIEAQTKAHLRFLEAGDVDDIERFVLQLNTANGQGGPGSPDATQALGGLREMAGAGGAMGQPGLGGPATPDERMPTFAAGGFGAGAQLQ